MSLKESFWDNGARAAMQRYYVIDAATGEASRYGQTINAYDDAGFEDVTASPSMGKDEGTDDLMVITARKPYRSV